MRVAPKRLSQLQPHSVSEDRLSSAGFSSQLLSRRMIGGSSVEDLRERDAPDQRQTMVNVTGHQRRSTVESSGMNGTDGHGQSIVENRARNQTILLRGVNTILKQDLATRDLPLLHNHLIEIEEVLLQDATAFDVN